MHSTDALNYRLCRTELDFMFSANDSFKGKNVLVVEDNTINQEVICELLKLMELDVDIASGGREALTLMEQKHYDLVLLDLMMPEIDGYETAKAIRKAEEENKKRKTFIIALTANALEGEREHCLAAGIDDYLSKPLDIKKLRTIMLKQL